MNNSEYSAYLECQLTGCYDREIPPMDDDILESEDEHSCPMCGCDVARWTGQLGNVLHWNCRNCGYTSYIELE